MYIGISNRVSATSRRDLGEYLGVISHLHIYHPGAVDIEQPADLVRLMVHVRVRALDGRLTSMRRNSHGKVPVIDTNYRGKLYLLGEAPLVDMARHVAVWRRDQLRR